MSKIQKEDVFTSESVGAGHPDKMCAKISDAVLDACLLKDPASRVACETMAAHDTVVNGGEITCAGREEIDTEQIVRDMEFFIDPTGSFVLGGPYADCGLTGRPQFPREQTDRVEILKSRFNL